MLAALLAVALVSFVVIRSQQGSGSQIIYQQGSNERLTADDVSRVVRVARSPGVKGAATGISCRPGTQGLLRNPWSCTLDYPAHERISWVIQILPNGHYVGVGQTVYEPGKAPQHFGGVITGCCIAVP
jgi:hypothetical protein